MKRILLNILLACLPVLGASAYDCLVNGICYNLSNGEASVTSKTPKYSGDIVIPSTIEYNNSTYQVTSIEAGAFWECSNLTSLYVPNTVVSIGSGAVSRCTSLTTLILEDGSSELKFNDSKPFYSPVSGGGYSRLNIQTVYLGRNISSSSSSVDWFNGFTSLKSITIGNLVTDIPSRLCYGCMNLTTIKLGESLSKISSFSFMFCESVTEIALPASIQSIEEQAFYGCKGLKNLVIPQNVKSIGYCAFFECEGLTTASVNSETIGKSAFLGCTALNSLTLGNNVTSIGEGAFSGCPISSISIPNNVVRIEEYAFRSIKELTIEDGEETLDCNLRNMGPLEQVYLGRNVPEQSSGLGGIIRSCSTLRSLTIGDKVTQIYRYAFEDCANLTNVSILGSNVTIGYGSFENCTSLTSVSIAGGIIGDHAFYDCTSLTSVSIAGGMIGDYAFYDCSNLSDLTMGPNVTAIGESAFEDCSSLHSVILPNSLTNIEDYAFAQTSSLKEIAIPNSVTAIGRYAFALNTVHITDMAAWCSIAFGENWNGDSSDAGFNLYIENEKVTSLFIPKEATIVNALAFFNCKGIESINVEDGNEKYDSRQGCNAIIETESNTLLKGCKNSFVPSDVTAIADYAFLNCDGLTSVTLGSGMQQIGSLTFYGCKLRNVLVKNATPPRASTSCFSAQTFYHTTLYIPTGSWDNYAYDDSWYRFINIRETATTEAQLTMQQAYMLMDANKFSYSVYDPVNDCIGTIGSVSGIDENNPNHCWQVVENEGKHYLFNIGAKKFAVPSANGNGFVLSEKAACIDMKDGEEGIIIDNQPVRQWALVSNDRMAVAQDVIDDIITGMPSIVTPSPQGVTRYYDLNGQQLQQPKNGLNIIRTADGRIVKSFKK